MLRLCGVILALVLCGNAAAFATTYSAMTFNELVSHADVIFAGEVIDVRPYPLQTREGTVIKTRVTFRVADPLYGTSSALEILDFFGGEWGGIGMGIADMPRFVLGDRRVVFARRERSINPIVGFTQGVLRITRDATGVDRVFTAEGVPLAQAASIGAARGAIVRPAAAMPLAEFRTEINRALVEARRR